MTENKLKKTIEWLNGFKYESSENENGEWHGLCKAWYGNGNKLERSNWKNGKKHGLFEYWSKDGTKEIRNWKDGKKDGIWYNEYDNKRTIWKDGKNVQFRCYGCNKIIDENTDTMKFVFCWECNTYIHMKCLDEYYETEEGKICVETQCSCYIY